MSGLHIPGTANTRTNLRLPEPAEDCVARRLVLPRALWDRVDAEARERGLSPETFAARAIEAGVAPIELETKRPARGRKAGK